MSVNDNETSPLLWQSSHSNVEYGYGSSTLTNGSCSIKRHGHIESNEDEESQRKQDNGIKGHEGLPAVKAQLKYLMPAIGLGVCFSSGSKTRIGE